MHTTGNSFTDYVSLGISFLPLLPAMMIIGRRRNRQEPFNFLVVICLLCFFRGFLGWVYPGPDSNSTPAGRIVVLLLFLFFFLTFRSNLGGRLRYGLDLFLTALLSVLCTYWWLRGWDETAPAIEMLLNSLLVGMISISLPRIIRNDELGVFRSPLFWIEGGTLFYLLSFLLLEGVDGNRLTTAGPAIEKSLLLGFADLVRYLSYIVAVFAL